MLIYTDNNVIILLGLKHIVLLVKSGPNPLFVFKSRNSDCRFHENWRDSMSRADVKPSAVGIERNESGKYG